MKNKFKTILQWGLIVLMFTPLLYKIPSFVARLYNFLITNKEAMINHAWGFYYIFIVMFIIQFVIAPCIHFTDSRKEDNKE